MKDHLQVWKTAFPDFRFEPVNVVAAGNTVVVEARYSVTQTGTLRLRSGDIPATGRSAAGACAFVFALDASLISRINFYGDYLGLLTQLGVVPSQIGTSA